MKTMKKYFLWYEFSISRTIRISKSHFLKVVLPHIDDVGVCSNHMVEKKHISYAVTRKMQVLSKVNIQTKFIK